MYRTEPTGTAEIKLATRRPALQRSLIDLALSLTAKDARKQQRAKDAAIKTQLHYTIYSPKPSRGSSHVPQDRSNGEERKRQRPRAGRTLFTPRASRRRHAGPEAPSAAKPGEAQPSLDRPTRFAPTAARPVERGGPHGQSGANLGYTGQRRRTPVSHRRPSVQASARACSWTNCA
jgi:hypothetical protein